MWNGVEARQNVECIVTGEVVERALYGKIIDVNAAGMWQVKLYQKHARHRKFVTVS